MSNKSWREMLEEIGGYENELVGVPAGAVREMVDEIERLTADVREANHEKHMAVVKKLSEISLLKGGWLDAIKAIDWFEEQTAEPCEPYPQSERDEDRKWLEDSTASGSQKS